jgi:hypothetical protein
MVPYYNLPELHEVLKSQLPTPYNSIYEVYKEMIPALIKQCMSPLLSSSPPLSSSKQTPVLDFRTNSSHQAVQVVLAVLLFEMYPLVWLGAF